LPTPAAAAAAEDDDDDDDEQRCAVATREVNAGKTRQLTTTSLNPLKGRDVNWLHLAIQV